jgi:hypothetical protein
MEGETMVENEARMSAELLAVLAKILERYPDLRLMQCLLNVIPVTASTYNFEDAKLMVRLKEVYKDVFRGES